MLDMLDIALLFASADAICTVQTRHSNKPKRGANTFAIRGRPAWKPFFGCFGGILMPIVGLLLHKALGVEKVCLGGWCRQGWDFVFVGR